MYIWPQLIHVVGCRSVSFFIQVNTFMYKCYFCGIISESGVTGWCSGKLCCLTAPGLEFRMFYPRLCGFPTKNILVGGLTALN